MSFDSVACAAAAILSSRGHDRLIAEPGWCWDNQVNRVRLSAPGEASPTIAFMIVREHYERSSDGTRSPQRREPGLMLPADATAKRIADEIEGALQNTQ
jgi:hypothetical protein